MKNLTPLGFEDYCVTDKGRVYSLKSARFLNHQYNDNGYCVITLRKNGKTSTQKIHRLVALMYKSESYFEGAHVNHKDGDKSNNCATNLEWCTRSENMLHAYKNSLIVSKPRQLTDDVVHLICKMLETGARVIDVSKNFNVDRTIVYSIFNRTAYNYISFEYSFDKVNKQERISTEKIIQVCDLLSNNVQQKDVSDLTGVHYSSVKMIKQRRIHQHISDSYIW